MYVNFNRVLTKAQIEALGAEHQATNGKIYFATDDGVYVGNADGSVSLKANSGGDITSEPLAPIDDPTNAYYTKPQTDTLLSGKQNTLVSGTNIKTVNNNSLLGSGNITIDPNNTFIARYDETSFADVKAAYLAGKTVVCLYLSNASGDGEDLYLSLFRYYTDDDPGYEYFQFAGIHGNYSYAVFLNEDDDEWWTDNVPLAYKSDLNNRVPYYNTTSKSVQLYGGYPTGQGSLTLNAGKASSAGSLTMGYADNNANTTNNSIQASSYGAFAGGYSGVNAGIVASGNGSIAFGYNNANNTKIQTSNEGATAMGVTSILYDGVIYSGNLKASGIGSHAEGVATDAEAVGSHAEGVKTLAGSDAAHAEGFGTVTDNTAEHAEGKWNKSNVNTISSIGIGTADNDRKNAFEVMANGDAYLYGVGGYDGTNTLSGSAATIQGILKNKCLLEKTYPSYTISQNNNDYGWLFFINVVPTSTNYSDSWYIRYRLYVTTTEAQTQGVYDVYISVAGVNLMYSVWNNFASTSYRPIYQHVITYYNDSSKYNNRSTYPIKIGARVNDARLSTTLARNFKIEIYETYGCDVTFNDTIQTYGSFYNTNYYGSTGAINSYDYGLHETGDLNDVRSVYLPNSRIVAGTNGLKIYSLCMEDGDGRWQSFSTNSGTPSTKIKNPTGFKLGSRIYWLNMTADIQAGSVVGNSVVMQNQGVVDLRYSFNIAANSSTVDGFVRYKPVYVVGTIGADGLFYLADTWWTQTEPTTEDGKIYIKVAEAVYDDYGTANPRNYRADLVFDGTPYAFKDGAFRPWDSVVDRTLEKDVFGKGLFGGMEIAPGPLYYEGTSYQIASDWTVNSYDDKYDKVAGSSYFNCWTISEDNPQVNGFRYPRKSDMQILITTDKNVRPGSTVNGATNKHYALIKLTGVTYCGTSTPNGLLIFPDYCTITGKTLSGTDNNTQTTGVTLAELNEYIRQGCAFLPASGCASYQWDDELEETVIVWETGGDTGQQSLEIGAWDEFKFFYFTANLIGYNQYYPDEGLITQYRFVRNANPLPIQNRITNLESKQSPIIKGAVANSGKSDSSAAIASANGSLAFGSTKVDDEWDQWGEIKATGSGAVALGCADVDSDGMTATIHASGTGALAFGRAYGTWSDADILASGNGATAHGCANSATIIKATAPGAHAEGYTDDGDYGYSIEATGTGSHAEGCAFNYDDYEQYGPRSIVASGRGSHAEGVGTQAIGVGSHAEGWATTAQNKGEHAEGCGNISHKVTSGSDAQKRAGSTQHSIGVGYFDDDTYEFIPQNAVEVMQNGDVYIKGIGGYDGTNPNTNGVKTLQQMIQPLNIIVHATKSGGVVTGFTVTETTGQTPMMGMDAIVTLDMSNIDSTEQVSVGSWDVYQDDLAYGPYYLKMLKAGFLGYGDDSYSIAAGVMGFDSNGNPNKCNGPIFHYYDDGDWIGGGHVMYNTSDHTWFLWYP